MKITHDMLVQANACSEQLAIFDREWPDGAEVTLENALRAVELELDFDWFARRRFSAAAWAAFNDSKAAARAAFNEATAAAWAAYSEAIASAWAAYKEAAAPARAACNNALAAAFFETFELEGIGQDEDHA